MRPSCRGWRPPGSRPCSRRRRRPVQGPERARQRRRSARRAADRRRRGSATRPADGADAGRAARRARRRRRRTRRRLSGRRCSARSRSSARASSTRSISSCEKQRYDRAKTGVARPMYDPSLDAMQPALAAHDPRRVRGGPGARDPARAEHGEGVQPRSGHHRRPRSGSGRWRISRRASARVIYGLDFPHALARAAARRRRAGSRAAGARPGAEDPAALEKSGHPVRVLVRRHPAAARLRAQRRARGQGRPAARTPRCAR